MEERNEKPNVQKFSSLNRRINKMTSEELNNLMKDKSYWKEYQRLRKISINYFKEYMLKKGEETKFSYEIVNDQALCNVLTTTNSKFEYSRAWVG